MSEFEELDPKTPESFLSLKGDVQSGLDRIIQIMISVKGNIYSGDYAIARYRMKAFIKALELYLGSLDQLEILEEYYKSEL